MIAQVRERRPYQPGRIGLVPWLPLQFLAILGVIVCIAHLISLWTGEPLVGRFMR